MVRRRRILFVDDEPSVISGLRRRMHSSRAEWETFGAPGGSEALDILSQNDIDVIVSDMRMPGMMGYDLLEEVRKRHPRAIRLALSGQASRVDVDKCVGAAHRFLSKPCGAETIEEALTRARVLMEMPLDDRFKSIIHRLQALPSLPEAYDRLRRELDSEAPTSQAVAPAISRDVALSLRVLQLVSSSFYSAGMEMTSLARQTELLGVDVFQRLARSPVAFCRCSRPEGESFSLAGECNHARTVASFARRIVKMEGGQQHAAEEAYAAGLLHDVGKIVWISQVPDEYDEVLSMAREREMALVDAEYKVLQATHAAAGAYLLGLWGLPDAVVAGAAFHHKPPDAPEGELIAAVMIHAADALAHEFAGASDGIPHPELNESYMGQAGLAHRASAWRDACMELAQKEMKHESQGIVC